jgi:hypothetical protein
MAVGMNVKYNMCHSFPGQDMGMPNWAEKSVTLSERISCGAELSHSVNCIRMMVYSYMVSDYFILDFCASAMGLYHNKW